MTWSFEILNNRTGDLISIDEPTGWDATKIKVSRDPDTHGIFFDYQGNDFLYYGTAFSVIKEEYDAFGVQGDLTLIISQDCGKGKEELYRGKFLLSQYKDHCGDECYCRVPVENTGDVMQLRNRWDQEVDLESLKAFDEVTILPQYEFLGKEITLTSKAIFVQNDAELGENEDLTVKLGEIPWPVPPLASETRYAWFNIAPRVNKINMAEFGNFAPQPTTVNTFVCYGTYDDEACPELDRVQLEVPGSKRMVLFDWASSPALMYYNPENPNNLDFVSGFKLDINFQIELTLIEANVSAWHNLIIKRRADGSLEILDNTEILNTVFAGPSWAPGTVHTIDYAKTLESVTLQKGEYLFVTCCGIISYSGQDYIDNLDAYTVKVNSATFKASALSYSNPSNVKFFLINEAFSRIAEAITDDKIRVYSEYFGRTDSQPYPVETDGCGALQAITKGLFIRGVNERDGEQIIFSRSMKNMWEGLDPVHHLGCGLEDDTRRLGYKCLRVEPWRYFYKTGVLFSCNDVSSISREVIESEHYSTFTFGYDKWEAEEFNGLDEFLTKRKYRTTLSQVKNELSKLSKMVASGYAIEITKRKGNIDSKDWRYDNDTFLLCLSRDRKFYAQFNASFNTILIDYSGPSGVFDITAIQVSNTQFNNGFYTVVSKIVTPNSIFLTVSGGTLIDEISHTTTFPGLPFTGLYPEQGGIVGPDHIIDPDTIYNFRISPLRNAMRWTDKVFASYKQISEDSKIVFTDGEGNYFASGLMSGNCVIELAAMMENETINPSKFVDTAVATPLLKPERLVFEYPMTLGDFKAMLANPYGLIVLEDSCSDELGWIDEVVYSPNEGSASFKIIPAYDGQKLIDELGLFTSEFVPAFE